MPIKRPDSKLTRKNSTPGRPTGGIKSTRTTLKRPTSKAMKPGKTSEVADVPLQTVTHIRKAQRREMIRIAKRENLETWFTAFPAPGETWHIISDAQYDFWTWVPVLLGMLRKPVVLYGSTWTMNRDNCIELLTLFDTGGFSEVSILTGDYFKRRESAVYAELYLGLQARGQRYVAFKNHAKVLLMSDGTDYLTIEGSANFTSNPRRENYTFTNDLDLYLFHKAWMDEIYRIQDS